MLKIGVLSFNPFAENTIVLSDESGECVIIDAGNYSAAEDKAISKYIEDNNLKPVMLIGTHGHIDHILGVNYLKNTYNIGYALNSKDAFLVESAPTHGAIYGFKIDSAPTIDIDLKEESEIKFGVTTLQIIETPGHTPGHIALYNAEQKILITGDTLFKESIGRTDLPGGDYSWIMKSIIDNIMPLGGDITFYPGHGPASTLGHEALFNPFITEVLGGEVNYR